jgi:hypothetical protein
MSVEISQPPRAMQRPFVVFVLALLAMAPLTLTRAAEPPGTEEFGMTPRQLVQSIEKVEAEIEKCMRAQGFQYLAVDYDTVRKGMQSDKRLPGMSESEFIDKYGSGVSTLYTGLAPQLVDGYSPGRVGLGDRNVATFKSLSSADQVAYNRALLGQHVDATFAVTLERENFSRTGGCTRKAIELAFTKKQMEATYYNPKDDLINKDPRMKAVLRKYQLEMRKAGFDYAHPDDVTPDITKRLNALTRDRTVPVDQLTPDQQKALKALQDYERRVTKKNAEMREELFDPVEAQIEKELYSRAVK